MARFVILLQLFTVSVALGANPTAADLSRAVRETAADPAECYRVRDLNFTKEDIRVYLTEGYLIFSKPVEGRRLWVAFSSNVEGGDGEVILFPPTRSERQSLASFTQSPNLDEHLRSAFMVFTDGTADRLLEQIQRDGTGRKTPEMGAVIASDWSPVAANIAAPMQMRIVEDILAPSREGSLVFLALSGKSLGNFDVVMDGRAGNQIVARHRTEREGKPAYDLWTSFPARSIRNGSGARPEQPFTLANYRIDASLDAVLRVQATTKVSVRVGANARRVFPFLIAGAMQVRAVKIDGAPVEILVGDSIRGRIAGNGDEEPLLVVSPDDLSAGTQHEFEFEHSGNVIATAGDGVYFVNARGSWYPHVDSSVATFDVRFRYPRRLTLVTAGDPVEDNFDGDWHITRRKTAVPVSSAGFNLGNYEKTTVAAPGITIDVYGNRHVEDSLKPRVVYMPVPQAESPLGRGRGRGLARPPVDPVPMMQLPPDPLGRLKSVAADMSSSMEFYTSLFGAPAMKHVTVAPIPGTFGQGFPGLVYMSTIAYLDPEDRPAALRNSREQMFYSDLIVPHEAAHQWWGAVVTVQKSEDGWLLEGLANYSALMWLEKKKGSKEVQKILDGYRGELVNDASGKGSPESAGPIVWGDRLFASEIPDAWRTITYAKGTWVLHMLRKRLGDERFLSMLAEMRKRYEFKSMTTEGLRSLAVEFRPKNVAAEAIEGFFDSWVYSSGVPALKVKSSTKASAPKSPTSAPTNVTSTVATAVVLTGTVEQSGVDEDFSVDVPVDIQYPRGVVQTVWVHTSGEETPFSTTLKQAPTRVVISDDILSKK